MNFYVGYQISDGWIPYIIQNRDRISGVYFAWGDFPNGRARMNAATETMDPWEIEARQLADLQNLHDAGIELDLLLNGMCYGAESQSRALFERIGNTVDFLCERFSLSAVTTTSPLIAKFLKSNFPRIKVRASVNMEIGTVEGMRYVAQYFDSFYMKREYNRDLCKIYELTAWCKDNGKELGLLANSGCLNFCSAHQFHDNLVAHEAEISAMDNGYQFRGVCWDFLSDPNNFHSWLQRTNFIRPEDIELYHGIVPAVKLATRVNSSPSRVLAAYVGKRYRGSVMELLEPNHSGVFYPNYIENANFDSDFASHVMSCNKRCEDCSFCANAMRRACIKLAEDPSAKI